MKHLAILIITVASLLVGTLSSPASHGAVMAAETPAQSGSHDCCPDTKAEQQTECHNEASFCQHCEQHCAGQIGLISGIAPHLSQASEPVSSATIAALAARKEPLIRPPK
ncbi:hypothetical protein LG288_01965 [Idiomarina seosinensis]|uniref:hypothetical protein n=1 Tax=Idiomarina seosinensis TaxID=281739 RepID=UPI00384F9B0A